MKAADLWTVRIFTEDVSSDINIYIFNEMGRRTELRTCAPSIREEIRRKLRTKSQGM
jgi:hypothetical protein